MSDTRLQGREQYEERYDKITVEFCREREEMVQKLFGDRPPLDSRGDADPANGYYIYSVFYFQFVEALAGERWQEREKTINEWVAEDEAKDRRLAGATPAVTPYCRSCGEDMQITLRSYLHRDRPGAKAEDDILFMFDCKPCHKRLALWQDGTEWEGYQARCEKCGVAVEETDKRQGNVITSTYTCSNCGHRHKSTMTLGAKANPKVDPYFKLDRRRFCFDAATGEKFLTRKAHLEHIGALLEKGRQHLGSGTVNADPITEAVQAIQRLKIAQVSGLLAKAVTKVGYSEFKLGEPQIGREVMVPFGCLDTKSERESYDSRMGLKKLITDTLAGTNWRLMSDGIHHRVGYLSGRLRAYESEDDLRKLVEKQAKSGEGKQPASTPFAPPSEPPESVPAEPAPAKQSSRGRPVRGVRVRGVLHQNLHILIPPREPKGPARQSKRRKSKGA